MKASFPLFVTRIIGSMIVIGLLLILFLGFANPFLDFLIDSERVKFFNKFMIAISNGCSEGAETIPYLRFTSPSEKVGYAIGLFGVNFTKEISRLPECSEEKFPCTTSISKARLKKCTSSNNLGEMYCWCLLKIIFNEGYCINMNHNLILVQRISPWDSNGNINQNGWTAALGNIGKTSKKFAEELNSTAVKEIRVLDCRTLSELGCVDERTGFPIFLSYKDNDTIVWIDPIMKIDVELHDPYFKDVDTFVFLNELSFDSISVERRISNYGGNFYLEYYTEFYSNPEIRYYEYFNQNANNTIEKC